MVLQGEWESILKTAGPLGVVFLLAVMGIVGAARWFKSLMEGTLADSRKERDANRAALEAQATKFLESLKIRDDIQEKGFDEILRELRIPRRK
jgi:flagellar biosynthesis/type III secretory pathway M-ring protein FliF/YscJ